MEIFMKNKKNDDEARFRGQELHRHTILTLNNNAIAKQFTMNSNGIAIQDCELTPSDMAQRLRVKSPQQVNKYLVEHGYQVECRRGNGRKYYELTPQGIAVGGHYRYVSKKYKADNDNNDDVNMVQQLFWTTQTLYALANELKIDLVIKDKS